MTTQYLNTNSMTSNQGLFIFGPSVGSYAGYSVLGGEDFNCDGEPDQAIGAPEARNDGGSVYILYSYSLKNLNNQIQLSNTSSFEGLIIQGPPHTANSYGFGYALSWVKNAHSDCSSILITSNYGGAYYLKSGDNFPKIINATDIGSKYPGSYIYSSKTTFSAITATDFNNNPYQVLILGSPYYNTGGTIYGIYMNSSMPSSINVADIGKTINGFIAYGVSGSNAGLSVGYVKNFFGDNCSSIVIGAPHFNTAPSYEQSNELGQVYILKCNATLHGSIYLNDIGNTLAGSVATGTLKSYSGSSVSDGGFLNCQDTSTLLIASEYEVYGIYGNSSFPKSFLLSEVGVSINGFNAALTTSTSENYIVVNNLGVTAQAQCGSILIGFYDLNTVYVVNGGDNLPNNIYLENMTSQQGFGINGYYDIGGYFGFSLDAAGDVNKDGSNDIIVGAYDNDGYGITNIIYTSPTGFVLPSPTVAPTATSGTYTPTKLPTFLPTFSLETSSPTQEAIKAPTLFPTTHPSLEPTFVPSSATYINTGGSYNIAGSNQNFVINTDADVTLYGSGNNNMFTLEPNPNVLITVTNFNNYTDLINLKSFNIYNYNQLNITAGSIIITLEDNQIMKLSNLNPVDINEQNFIFAPEPITDSDDNSSNSLSAGAIAGIAIAGTAAVATISYLVYAYMHSSWPFIVNIVESTTTDLELAGGTGNPIQNL